MEPRFTVDRVRVALAIAARHARPGQRPVALYRPKQGDPLVVLSPDDLAALLGEDGDVQGEER